MKRARAAVATCLGLAGAVVPALVTAAPPAGSAPSASASASAPAPASAPASASASASATRERVYSTCIERVPEGATRPTVTDTAPAKVTSGHAFFLKVVVAHGAGESVLAHGYAYRPTKEIEELDRRGFTFLLPDGGVGPTLTTSTPPGTTTLEIPILAAPAVAGDIELDLPPVPVAVSRASGEIMTVCTSVHRLLIEDPTAKLNDPRARPNPPGRRQMEPFFALMAGLLVLGAALAAYLLVRVARAVWRRIPKRVAPPPPPPAPWEVALRALDDVRARGRIERGELSEHVDETSDVVRRYLGERFGFEGLEATSREIRRAVARVTPAVPVIPEIDRLLDESDLVKFANVPPAPEACHELLALAETIVRATIPAPIERAIPVAPERRARA